MKKPPRADLLRVSDGQPRSPARQTLLLQTVVVALGGLLAGGFFGGGSAALAVLYGGFIAMLNAGILLWRTHLAQRRAAIDARQDLRLMYRTGLERLLLAGVLLALGMGPLKLDPLMLVAGFVLGQCAWLVAVTAGGLWRVKG